MTLSNPIELINNQKIKFVVGELVEAKENGLWYKAKIIKVFS
jgi:hypothetical protein